MEIERKQINTCDVIFIQQAHVKSSHLYTSTRICDILITKLKYILNNTTVCVIQMTDIFWCGNCLI